MLLSDLLVPLASFQEGALEGEAIQARSNGAGSERLRPPEIILLATHGHIRGREWPKKRILGGL
jgi:hypothetical protein